MASYFDVVFSMQKTNNTSLDKQAVTMHAGSIPPIAISKYNVSRDTKFLTMWYVRPAKPQTSLRIRAV